MIIIFFSSTQTVSGGPSIAGDDVRKMLKEFTLNVQQKLERERSELLVRATTAETKLKKLEQYIKTNMAVYQKEIVRLKAAAKAQ